MFGFANTAIGSYSLYTIDGGTYNVALGMSALESLQTGDYNTAVGYSALSSLDVLGSNNVGLGYQAGNGLFNGDYNTFLGANSSAANDGLTNSTTIGWLTQVSDSNRVVIGNTDVTDVYIGSEDALATVHAASFIGDGSALTGISTGAVSSVFTRTGAITAQPGDYTVSQITGAAPLASPGLTGTPTFAGSTSGATGVKASATASGTLTLPAATDTLVGKNTTDILTNKTLTSPVINNSTVNTHVSPKATVSSVSGVTTCDASVKESFVTTLTENTALLITNAQVDQIIRVKVIQAATPFTFTYSGTMTITWYTSSFSAPTIPATNGKAMKLVLECTGTNTFDGFWAGNNG